MAYTISNLKNELTGVLHGTSLSKVQGLDVLIDRAARRLVNDIDPIETVRIVQISNGIFDKVYDYPAPSDLKGDRIIDIRPQARRELRDKFFQVYNEDFDRNKTISIERHHRDEFSIQFNNGVKSLRIVKDLISPILIHNLDTIDENGTWSVGDDATNLREDNINFVQGSGSLRFDTSGAGTTAFLENSDFQPIDLSRDENQGSLFLFVFLPDPSLVTSWNLRWGNDTLNFWDVTVTTAFDSTVFQTGWNQLKFDWNGATVTGTPDSTAVDYSRITLTYDGTADTDYRVDNLTSNLPEIFELEYYSKFLFQDATTLAFQERVTDDTNIVNLDTDAYNLLFNLVAYFVAQQVQAENASFDASYWINEYDRERARYTAKTKSQIIKPQRTYYTMPFLEDFHHDHGF